MAILFKDRVKDSSTTTGTGSFTIANSAPTGFQTFNAAYSTGSSNKFYYAITLDGGSEWEVGIGYLSSSTVLVRDTVISSSNSNAAVNFSAGAKTVFSTVAAKNFVPVDGSISPTNGYALIYNSTTGLWAPAAVPNILTSTLASDAVYNNTSSLANTALSVTVAASATYIVQVVLVGECNGHALKFDFGGGTATATLFQGGTVQPTAVTSFTGVSTAGANSTAPYFQTFFGIFIVNAGGTFILRGAQIVAGADNTKIYAGSNMTLTKLN